MATKKPKPQYGVTGFQHSNGYIYEEFLKELTGIQGRRKFKEMACNDATIGSILTATSSTIRPVDWKIEKAVADTDGKYSDWFETVLDDMDHSFDDWLTEALTMQIFGFSLFEKVFKLRQGKQNDPYRSSKYNDGTIGIKKLDPRPQETVYEWDITDKGDTIGFWQVNPNGWENIYIPMDKCLLLRTASIKNNPEGVSILRNCYKSYTFLNNIQMIEAIAIERELAGVPVVRVPSEVLTNPEMAPILNKYIKIARDLKMGEQGGIVLPSDLHESLEDGKLTSTYKVSVELISSQGNRLIDTDTTIKRYQLDIARSILADFLMLGINDRGSFSMSKNKTDIFLNTLQTYTKELASGLCNVRNDLWEMNGFPEEMKPDIIPGQLNPTNLEALGNYVAKLAASGVMMTDEETQKMLRRAADLPENIDYNALIPLMPEAGTDDNQSSKDTKE